MKVNINEKDMKGNKTYRLVRVAAVLVAGLAMLCSMSSCRDELELLKGESYDMFTVTVGCDIAGVQPVYSRADEDADSDGTETSSGSSSSSVVEDAGGRLTDPENASIVILLFNEQHMITGKYEGKFINSEDVPYTIVKDGVEHYYTTQHVSFSVSMVSSDQKHYMHIIVNHNDLDLSKIQVGETESSLMTSDLMVVENQDVYWQRVELDNVTEETVKAALDHVALIRNYAKLSLDLSLDESSVIKKDQIKSLEWALMNIPTKSFVAPYISANDDFAKYVTESTTTTFTTGSTVHNAYVSKDYEELYKDGYRCCVPRTKDNATTFYSLTTDKEADNLTWTDQTKPLYQYENEGSSESSLWNKTVILFKLTLNDDDDDDTNNTVYYYRVGLTDPERNYASLYVFRNIHYEIKITGIEEGLGKASYAFNQVAANNVSGSVQTESFTNVTAQKGTLRVEYTKKYVFSPADFTLNARYVPDITKLNEDDKTYISKNECVKVGTAESYTSTESEPKYCGDDNTKYVIKSEPTKLVESPDNSKYCQFTFTPNIPQSNGLSTVQRIRVSVKETDDAYTVNNQLYRTIELILRERYKIQNMQITKEADGEDDYSKNCFMLTVDIPSGLPKDIFPLTFCFQTEPPCTYPNANKSIMEVDGVEASIFDTDRKESDSFVYHRDVTYELYNSYKDNNGYKSVPFYFKILDVNLTDGQEITFGVTHDAFSIDPTADIGQTYPKIITGVYTYHNTDDDITLTLVEKTETTTTAR